MDESAPLLDAPKQPVQYDRRSTAGDDDLGRLNTVRTICLFDPDGDPANPRDWPSAYKWSVLALLAFMSFTTTFTCVGIVPIAGRIVLDLEGHASKSSSVLLVTIWELGEAAGPLLIAPLSEVYGRYPAYNYANSVFIVGTTTVALSQTASVLIFGRFLTGLAVASNVLNPSVVGDIFVPEQRGSALSIVFLTTLVGGAIGPAIGGAMAQSFGWRALVWFAAAIAVACELAFLCLFRETYSVKILEKRAKEELGCDDETANKLIRTVTGSEVESSGGAIWQAVKRPARVFFGSFVLQIMSLFGCIGFTFFYIMSTSLPDILRLRFGFGEAQTGISFLTFSIGSICGILICNLTVDRIYISMTKARNGDARPEYRLPLLIAGACLLPIAVALYGWAAQTRFSVAFMLFVVVFMGFSLLMGVVPLMAYVVDAFGIYSASATTALLVTRCLMGTFLPLAVNPLVAKLGYGWAFMVLAGTCVVVAPLPMLVLRYGRGWRQRSKYTSGGT